MNKETSESYVVLVTVPDEETGIRIARAIVQERLAACVNLIHGVRSVFRWEGEVCDEDEKLLLIKTSRERFSELARRTRSLHPYDVPEIIAVGIDNGDSDYLSWIIEETRAS
jgi:periplasmic divalent cation tolerance protein